MVRKRWIWTLRFRKRYGALTAQNVQVLFILAAVLSGYAQKGLPAFGIYGEDVQDAGTTDVPEDVKASYLDLPKLVLQLRYMRGKSYLSMGSVSMGIAGSIVNDSFLPRIFRHA